MYAPLFPSKATWARIWRAIQAAPSPLCRLPAGATQANFLWAMGAIHSRAWRTHTGVVALIPLADIINHRSSAKNCGSGTRSGGGDGDGSGGSGGSSGSGGSRGSRGGGGDEQANTKVVLDETSGGGWTATVVALRSLTPGEDLYHSYSSHQPLEVSTQQRMFSGYALLEGKENVEGGEKREEST